MAIPHNNDISLRFFKLKNTTCYLYTVQTPLTLHLIPEDGPVQGPKHVVFSLNKRLLQILQLCSDLPYVLPHETSCFIKRVEFLCWIRKCQLLKNWSMKRVVKWLNTITRRYINYASLNKINIIPTNVKNGSCLTCPLRSDTLVFLRHYSHHWQTEAFK
jgi:hypothetical protein